MTGKQIAQAEAQLPEGESISRMYTAFEGGIRLISVDEAGNEKRYNCIFDAEDNVILKEY